MGPEAEGAEVGRSYVIYPWINCGTCQPCRAGMTQVCDRPQTIGTRVDGAYSDHVIVPDSRFLVAHDGIDPNLACTLACSGLTAYSALKKVGLESLTSRDSLLIVGAGGVGLTALCLAKALCDACIVIAEIDPAKREAALGLGADRVVDSRGETAVGEAQAVGSDGIAAAIDFVGLPQTMMFGLAALRKGGLHVHVGLFGGAHSLSLPPLAFRMLRIAGSYVGTLTEFRELVALVQQGLDLPVPITPRPLEEAGAALQDLRDGKVLGRVVLKP